MSSRTALADMLRTGVHRDMAHAIMHPVLARTLDEVCGNWSLNVFHRVLHEPFERARSLDPMLTFADFVRGGGIPKHVLQAFLGEDNYTLITQHSGEAYFAARARVLAAARTRTTLVPQWLAWGHWGRNPVTVDVTGRTRLLPVDFPTSTYVNGVQRWVYPDFDRYGRPRLFQNHAYVELGRRLPQGVQIPLGGGAADLLTTLNLRYDPTPRPFTGIAALEMSDLQVARMLQTGQSPALEARVLDYDADTPDGFRVSDAGVSGRPATDARWELASRFGDPKLVLTAYFRKNAHLHPLAGETKPPTPARVAPGDPVALLSNADLVAMGRWDHYCKKIAYAVLEVEHRRGQRAVEMMEELLGALGQAVDTSLIRHLCGLCDPSNLLILTPAGHAAEDFYAAFVRDFSGNWIPGSSRLGAPVYARPQDHPGYPRAMNVFLGFSPYHLEPVAYLMRDLNFMQAVQNAGPEVREAYNLFAENVRAAMRSYEMDPSLSPQQFRNGEWK